MLSYLLPLYGVGLILLNQFVTCEDLKVIAKGDAYKIQGEITTFKINAQCNRSIAWLKPPVYLRLAYHGHQSACGRIKFPPNSNLGKKNATMSLLDLNGFSQLLSNEKSNFMKFNEVKSFFLKDRVEKYAVTVMTYPQSAGEREIKLDLINFQDEAAANQPDDILCAYSVCESPELPVNKQIIPRQFGGSNNTELLSIRLSSANAINTEYQRQIVVYRVVCALLGLLVILFGVSALVLCVKYRHRPRNLEAMNKMHSNSAIAYTTDGIQSPSFYHMNSKRSYPPHSPMVLQDGNGGFSTETGSVNNLMMTNSNLSACDNHGGSGTYVSYPMTSLASGNAYADNQGLVALVPVVNNRGRNMLVQCSNGTSSPASSLNDHKLVMSRNGSLTRPNGGSYNRRNIILNKSNCATPQTFNSMQPEVGVNGGYMAHQLPMVENSFGRLNDPNNHVVHRFPSDVQRSTTPRDGSLQDDHEGSLNTLHSSNCLNPSSAALIKGNGHIVVNS